MQFDIVGWNHMGGKKGSTDSLHSFTLLWFGASHKLGMKHIIVCGRDVTQCEKIQGVWIILQGSANGLSISDSLSLSPSCAVLTVSFAFLFALYFVKNIWAWTYQLLGTIFYFVPLSKSASDITSSLYLQISILFTKTTGDVFFFFFFTDGRQQSKQNPNLFGIERGRVENQNTANEAGL